MSTANRVQITTTSVARTRTLGRRLARLLSAGDVVLLQGSLGAGKTALTQGIGAALGVEGPVNSPTFVLLARHDPPEGARGMSLFHADLYRLGGPEEVDDLALGEQAADGVLCVEWPERAFEALPAEHLLVAIELDATDPKARRFTFVANGDRYRRVLDGLLAGGAPAGGSARVR